MMPVIFVSHSSPMLVEEAEKCSSFREWAEKLPKPRAILVISAHWLSEELIIGNPLSPNLIYDYYGFPERLYSLQYKAPPASNLVGELHSLLSEFHVKEENRGWDHGVFIPLLCMYPKADIPVVQISLPVQNEEKYVQLGEKLKELRKQKVLIIGSGGMTHNLRRVDFSDTQEPESWAVEFDEWVSKKLLEKDIESLIGFRGLAPHVQINHPTVEHFLPLLVAAGAGKNEPVSFPIEGFEYGNLSRKCIQFGI